MPQVLLVGCCKAVAGRCWSPFGSAAVAAAAVAAVAVVLVCKEHSCKEQASQACSVVAAANAGSAGLQVRCQYLVLGSAASLPLLSLIPNSSRDAVLGVDSPQPPFSGAAAMSASFVTALHEESIIVPGVGVCDWVRRGSRVSASGHVASCESHRLKRSQPRVNPSRLGGISSP